MITVRKTREEDIEQAAVLLGNKYHFSSVKQAREAFFSERRYQHVRVAECQDAIVGLISWRPQGTIQHGVAELTRIVIQKDANNFREIKEALFDVMIAEADYYYKMHQARLRKVFSMIHADDRQIKEFFMDKGMKQEAVLKDHYHKGTDELVFSLFFA